MWHIHAMEYYSALKRKGILTDATTWMNLEDIMLSEINQSQKDKYCMSLFICGTQSSQIETESRMVVARGCGEGRMGNYCLMRTEFQFGDMERVWWMDGGDGSTTT